MENCTRVLVVDDEAVIRDLLTEILSEDGFEVVAAASGEAALDILRQNNGFTMLFTDIMMPGMDGISLIREARKTCPSLLPIVMTGFATIETARAAVKEGAYDYVLKPFSLSEIKVAVTNALDRNRLTNENARLRELTELFKISETIAGIREEKRLFDFVLKAALERVNAERGSLMMTTEDGRGLEVEAAVNLPLEATAAVVKMGAGISGWVAENARPLLVTDIGLAPELARMSQRTGDPSFISIPLERKVGQANDPRNRGKQKPRVIAVLNVSNKRDSGRFNEGDLKTLSIIANHAAAAIDNVRLIRDIEQAHIATLESMALLLEAKDAYTHGHSKRVRDYSILAAKHLGMSEHDIDTLRLGAALHDIGKVGISDAILNKCEPLTEQEWDTIKRHPVIGYEVAVPVPFLASGHLDLIRSHHERMDGNGYPDGRRGADLPELVRIITVADSYDAMANSRAYRQAMAPARIAEEMQRCSGNQFDPRVVTVFIELIQAGTIESIHG